MEYILVDDLQIPIQLIAVSDQSNQSPYKLRQTQLTRKDIASQKELEAFAVSVCNKMKDPYDRLNLRVFGSAGLISGAWKWLPGYKGTINAPSQGFDNAEYRFMEIHHVIDKDATYDHVVEVKTVPATAKVSTQVWSYAEQTDIALLRKLRDRLRYFEQQAIETRDWYPALPKPYYDLWGKVPSHGLEIDFPQDNMLFNSAFEVDSDNDGVPDNWEWFIHANSPQQEIYTADSFEGKQCVQLTCDPTDDGSLRSDFVPVQEGKKYLLKCHVYSDTMAGNGDAALRIYWYDKDKGGSLGYSTAWHGLAINTWQEKSGLVTAPVGARYGRVVLQLAGGGSGSIDCLFDSVWMFKQITWSDGLGVIVKNEHLLEAIASGNVSLTGSPTKLSDWQDVISQISYFKTSFLTPSMGTRRPYSREIELVGSEITIQDGGANWVLVEEQLIKSVANVKLALEEMTFRVTALAALHSCYVQLRYQWAGGSETTYYTSGEIFTDDCPYEYTHASQVVGNENTNLTVRWYMRVLGSAPNWGSMDKRIAKTTAQQLRVNF